MIKRIITITLIFFIFFTFFKINEKNYEKFNEIKTSLIKHPENLPKKEIAKSTSFGFENLKADIYWLKTIQYIGANAFHSEYKKYLFFILDLVTDLNPYFEKPYIIGQLLLPGYEERYEVITKDEQKIHTKQAELIGIKGIKNFCNADKIKLINEETDLIKIWSDKKYENPCLSYKIPYYLAYIYYHYNNDPLTSSKFYKISSANKDSLEGAKIMAAIMQGKGGEREKSFFMFLNLSNFIEPENEICNLFGKELENIGVQTFLKKEIILNGALLENIEDTRKKLLENIKDEEINKESNCYNYINKSIRELNLEYLENANRNYLKDMGKNSINAKQLFDDGYINYLPVDFQKYDNYYVIYIFNESTGHYDYDMGIY